MRISFEFDWLEAGGVNGPELAATWASLRICVGEDIITKVLDERAKTVRDCLYVPLYPLAEWLATNWWFLTRECENPIKRAGTEFHRRHGLAAHREGYAYPDLEVVPTGALTRLRWRAGSHPANIEFLGQGEVLVESGEFREQSAALVDQVIRRLAALAVNDTFLHDEWAAIQSADEEESEFCRAAAGLGWDPYALDDGQRDWILAMANDLGDAIDEVVPALDVTRDRDWSPVTDAIATAKHVGRVPLERARACVNPLGDAAAAAKPRQAGWDLAMRLRQALDLGEEPLPTMDKLANALGERPDAVKKATTQRAALRRAPLIDGVVANGEDEAPAFAFRPLREQGKRFHFCRAVAEVLTPPGHNAVLTQARTERQQRNTAFAAEFLVPSTGLHDRVGGGALGCEDVEELARAFGVPARLIEHQVTQHGIASIRSDGL